MENQPGEKKIETPPSSDEALDAKMAELDKKMGELEATKAEFEAKNEGLSVLQDTMTNIIDASRKPAPAPEPAPEPLEWDDEHKVASAADVAGRVVKSGLEQYHNAISPELVAIKDGMKELEYERVRNEDPKNFDRLKPEIDKVVAKLGYSPKVIQNVFYQLRGSQYTKLREMDAADRLQEPVPDPAPASSGGRKGKNDSFDSLNSEELHVIRGLGTHPKEYFMRRYGREPNFEDGYVTGLGYKEEAK